MKLRIGILTVSDRCNAGQREDKSGPAIESCLAKDKYEVIWYGIVPDEQIHIKYHI